MSPSSGRASETPEARGRRHELGAAPPFPALAGAICRLALTVARPQGARSLRATPPARLSVLQRHAPSRLFASTPFGGPGGAQISASFAAIVCFTTLAQRRTDLAPGPPSTSEVARAPPRPPTPTLDFPRPTSLPSLAGTRPRVPAFHCPSGFSFIWPSHPPAPFRVLPIPAPHPEPLPGLLGYVTPIHQALRPSPTGSPAHHVLASHRLHPFCCSSTSSHQRLQPPAPLPSPSRFAPSLHHQFLRISFLCDSHSSCASSIGASTRSGLLIPISQGYRPLSQGLTPRLPFPRCPLPTAPNQPTSRYRILDVPFSLQFLCYLRTNTPVFLCLDLAPLSL